LFVSGAHIASDMIKNETDRNFVRNVLKIDFGGTVSDVNEDIIFGSNMKMQIGRTLNEECYAVPRPDILVPVDDAFISFVYNGCKESAGVAYAGNYRTISVSFPFEAVKSNEQRTQLMGSIMRFLIK
ncbi:MAG: xanthan lyase, partial [Bacteroidaceae bacterium]|nr:xanthan lyase [Bacteroidaceae bacterium]